MDRICVNLQLAKELKKEGFPQNSKFFWVDEPNMNNQRIVDSWTAGSYHEKEQFASPCSDEILKEIPFKIKYKKYNCQIQIYRYENRWLISYNDNNEFELVAFSDKKLPNALAKMWLYLKKEGYIK